MTASKSSLPGRIAVIGAGTMGNGIAQTFATCGVETHLVDIDKSYVEKGMAAIDKSLGRFVKKEKMTADEAGSILARIDPSTDMGVLAGADLVIGHGPHVVRGMERYRDRLIAYSLGNFATYYGISVAGIKGIAPILTTTLDGEGRFIEGDIVSTIQLRPDGPGIDPRQRALNMMRGLSLEDFGNPGLTFLPDGKLLPADRPEVPRHELQTDEDATQ